jgi:hypothetical protein
MILPLKFFKPALMSNIKQWSSYRYRRRHRRSGTNVERKMKYVKGNC